MNKDLQNKISRLRGLLSSQAQMSGVPEIPAMPEAIDMMGKPGQPVPETDRPMDDACLVYKILNGPNAICPPDKGACCFMGSCFPEMMQTTCEGFPGGGGQYQGDGTSCDPDPCGGGMLTAKDIFMRGLQSLMEEKGMDGSMRMPGGDMPPMPQDPTMMG